MRYAPLHYAQALLDASDDKSPREQKEIMVRFLRLLKQHRALPRLNRIMKEVARRERARGKTTDIEVQSTSPIDEKLRSQVKRALDRAATVREAVRPDLLAGIRILINEETLVDASALRRLTTLFPKGNF